ncbi:MAG: TonB C-terminal domain-containing protein [Lentisphaerae bacterium]|nr:TonB C-terminal domain-containing protein [Lentisphaerota bacterium]
MKHRSSGAVSSASRRGVTFFLVALLHLCAVFGPLMFWDMLNKRTPKENAFRVKIGAAELSKGPDVGMPERKLPQPPPPEPLLPPAPQTPKQVAEPKLPVVKPKPQPKPKTKPKPKSKPAPKAKPKPKVTKKKTPPKKKISEPKLVKRPVKPPKKTVKPVPKKKTPQKRKNNMDDVFQDNTPVNINPRVPVGNRNRSQKYAPKQDNKTPGGGRKVDEAAFQRYGKNVENYIYSRWAEPPRALLRGEFPETVIEITIAANGRVQSAKVIRASGNRAMEDSVQALLSQLDLLPRPPDGRITFQITLKTR